MHLNNKFGTHVNLFILYRHEAILLFWIHLPEEVWQVVMAKMGEIQNYCFDKESNISLQWCGCSFRVFLDYWCFEKVQSHSQLNKKGLSFKPSLNTQSCNRGLKQFRFFLWIYYSTLSANASVFKKVLHFFWPRKHENNRLGPQLFLCTGPAAQTAQK